MTSFSLIPDEPEFALPRFRKKASERQNTSATRCALKINYAVKEIINPAIKAQYPESTYDVRQSVGIDTSELFVARTGIRGSNDLV
jgi:hypothetical protein